MCAKLVLNRRKYNDSSKEALADLHWVSMKCRLSFKTLTFMYICSDGQAPENLKELLSKLFTKTNHKLHFPQNRQSCYTFPFIKEKLLVTGVLVLLD